MMTINVFIDLIGFSLFFFPSVSHRPALHSAFSLSKLLTLCLRSLIHVEFSPNSKRHPVPSSLFHQFPTTTYPCTEDIEMKAGRASTLFSSISYQKASIRLTVCDFGHKAHERFTASWLAATMSDSFRWPNAESSHHRRMFRPKCCIFTFSGAIREGKSDRLSYGSISYLKNSFSKTART